MSKFLPFLLGAGTSLVVGLAMRPSATAPEDGIARVHSSGRLLLPGHTHGDLGLRLAGCRGCAAEFQRGVLSVIAQRAQAAQVNSGGAR